MSRKTTTTRKEKLTYQEVLGVGVSKGKVGTTKTRSSQAIAPALAQIQTTPKTLPSARPNLPPEPFTIPETPEDPTQNNQENLVHMSDEDDILEEPEEKILLSLRQKYKKYKCNLLRVDSHLSFIQECKRRGKIPRGLRVNVECNALLTDLSDVKQKFKATKDQAENCFTDSLDTHYEIAKKKLEADLHQVIRLMTSKSTCSRETVRKEHEEMLTKTEENINKQKERLDMVKNKKLQMLDEQPRRRRPPFNGPGMKRPSYQGTRINDSQGKEYNRPKTHTSAQPARPPNDHAAQQPQNEISELSKLLRQVLKQNITPEPQPPRMVMPPCAPPQQQAHPMAAQVPCTMGQQQPMLPGPIASTGSRQPPQLFAPMQQGFPVWDRHHQ